MIAPRDYGGAEDLARMHAVQAASLAREPRRTATTPGDLTWWLHQHPPDDATPKRVVVFEDGGATVAWAVLWLPVTLTYGVHPGRPDAHQAVLDWFERAAEGDEPLDVAFLEGDTATRDALAGRGYELAEDEGFLHHMAAELAERPELPPLPNGYRLEAVASGVGELEPVGTDSAHRRIGLGRAVCLEALRRLRELGATLGLVYSVDGEPSTALYRSVGFRSIDRHVQYRLPR